MSTTQQSTPEFATITIQEEDFIVPQEEFSQEVEEDLSQGVDLGPRGINSMHLI